MSAHRLSIVGAVFAFATLAACTENADGAKTERSSAERVAAQLDVCGEDGGEFAQRVCENASLAELDNQVRQTLVAQSAAISDAGTTLLIQNQNRWREAARVTCGIIDAEVQPDQAQQSCLEFRLPRARPRGADSRARDRRLYFPAHGAG